VWQLCKVCWHLACALLKCKGARSKEAIPGNVYDTLKSALVDKTKAENLLIKYYTNTDYTIVRPGLIDLRRQQARAPGHSLAC
jgi:hypothetical protein